MNLLLYSTVVVSLFAAALLGFSAHRASFCSVKAVAEVLSTRRAHMLTSFVKIALWVVAIAVPLSWATPPMEVMGGTWAFGMPALVGGAMTAGPKADIGVNGWQAHRRIGKPVTRHRDMQC